MRRSLWSWLAPGRLFSGKESQHQLTRSRFAVHECSSGTPRIKIRRVGVSGGALMVAAHPIPHTIDQTDRTPPQDVAAEQSVLGAMMMSKDAIANVVEVVKGRDFYRPAHELIYDAILDLYGRPPRRPGGSSASVPCGSLCLLYTS